MDVVLNNFFLRFPDLWVCFFCYFFVNFSAFSDLWVCFSEISPDSWVYFRILSRIYGWYFYDLTGTSNPIYLGNSSYPTGLFRYFQSMGTLSLANTQR